MRREGARGKEGGRKMRRRKEGIEALTSKFNLLQVDSRHKIQRQRWIM